MRFRHHTSAWIGAAWALALLLAPAVFAQQHNYSEGEIEDGTFMYRTTCVGCHGPDGNLVSGIDLVRGKFRRISRDEEYITVIINGIPGTGMPPSAMLPVQAYNIIGYLRKMNASEQGKSIAAAAGDAVRGKALFEGKGTCNSCHRVNGEGSRSGPDLSDAGAALRAIEIETSILDPDARISDNARPFRVEKKDGTAITGLLLNQDTFSVQLRDSKGRLASFTKSDLRRFEFLDKSPMPSYRGAFSPQELADLLAHLTSLKGFRSQ